MKQVQITTSQGLFTTQLLGAQGDWVVCWPGLALDHHCMIEFARLVANKHRVVLIDSPAVGLNRQLPYTPVLDDLVHYAHNMLMSLGIQRCHWVGLSSGGAVGAALHAAIPGYLQSLTLASAPMLSQSRVKLHTLATTAVLAKSRLGRKFLAHRFATSLGFDTQLEKTQVTAHYIDVLERMHPQTIAKMRPLAGPSVRRAFNQLSKKPLPTLVLCGKKDGIVLQRDQRTVAEITGAQLVEINCGHMNLFVQPQACATACLQFMQKSGLK